MTDGVVQFFLIFGGIFVATWLCTKLVGEKYEDWVARVGFIVFVATLLFVIFAGDGGGGGAFDHLRPSRR